MHIAINQDGKRTHKDNNILVCPICKADHYSYEHDNLKKLGWGPNFNIPIHVHKSVIKIREKDKDCYYKPFKTNPEK